MRALAFYSLTSHYGKSNACRCHGQVRYFPPRWTRAQLIARIAGQDSPNLVRYTHVLRLSGRSYSSGFAGNDSPSFVFPTAIATKGGVGGSGGSGSGRPAVANKPSFLTGGAGGSNLSAKRGTEDLDFFIGDEALTAASGPGMVGHSRWWIEPQIDDIRLWHPLSCAAWPGRKLGKS